VRARAPAGEGEARLQAGRRVEEDPGVKKRLVPLVLVCALAACSDRDAPRRVDDPGPPRGTPTPSPLAAPRADRSAAAGAAEPADPNDPAEPGIPDLARLARYVFRTMQRHEDVCPLENPYRDSLHFAFAIEVAGGRMARVGLAEVAFEGSAGKRTLPQAVWPRELSAYVACLASHLKAVAMSPAPADGAYQPFYSFAGRPDGIAAPDSEGRPRSLPPSGSRLHPAGRDPEETVGGAVADDPREQRQEAQDLEHGPERARDDAPEAQVEQHQTRRHPQSPVPTRLIDRHMSLPLEERASALVPVTRRTPRGYGERRQAFSSRRSRASRRSALRLGLCATR
jgi:hypothetical protein